jgi:hypothetical protein
MKRWLLVTGVIAIVCGICLFLLSRLTISTTVSGNGTMAAAGRCFENPSRWPEWWPKNTGYSYKIKKIQYGSVLLSAKCPDGSILDGEMGMAPLSADSILVRWTCAAAGGWDLLNKVNVYLHSGDIRRDMDIILDSMRSFVGKPKNIYGVGFYRTLSNDTTLVTITSFGGAYPTTAEVYSRVDSLRQYVQRQGASENGAPWLNVTKLSDHQYRSMIAIPVNRRLKGTARILPREFVPWKMIEGDVYGGVYTVEKAFGLMQQYRTDNNLSIMALPYQTMITDRRREPDTTKWVTRICAPIS